LTKRGRRFCLTRVFVFIDPIVARLETVTAFRILVIGYKEVTVTFVLIQPEVELVSGLVPSFKVGIVPKSLGGATADRQQKQ
jgi:hypothetical protein